MSLVDEDKRVHGLGTTLHEITKYSFQAQTFKARSSFSFLKKRFKSDPIGRCFAASALLYLLAAECAIVHFLYIFHPTFGELTNIGVKFAKTLVERFAKVAPLPTHRPASFDARAPGQNKYSDELK